MPVQDDIHIRQIRQCSKGLERIVNVEVPKIRQDVPAPGEVGREEYALGRHMHLDQVVAVRGAEMDQDDSDAAQLEFHRVLEQHLRNDGPSLLPDNVRPDIHVPDANRRVGEDIRIADVALVIVAQHHVLDGHPELGQVCRV